ncbi:YgjP-like metallopeptidase domain-containing protein [Dasania marina]|uniref:M48 metallopeptidase family protein n=1 Tax=Dasania marina TaxID=471499 RepID=UPI0030DAC954|tara:strand:- start:10695 stop:11198 length:504 start_codon:yes stop_codon:yes gene_type:complete
MLIRKYLGHYPPHIIQQVESLLAQGRLADFLLKRYPSVHELNNNQQLRSYVQDLKNRYLKKSSPLSKVIYDDNLHVLHNALGMHSSVSRVQGNKLKRKNEIRISAVFKKVPEPFLTMIAVHELAHLKESEHNKAFYRLCSYMLPDYQQLEFDTRLYLVQLEANGPIY